MTITFLQARNGDCIHLRFVSEEGYKNILIDGGTSRTYEFKNAKSKWTAGPLKELVAKLKEQNEKIDLLILTHVDDDHIAGILQWLSKDVEASNLISKVWFNSSRLISEYYGDPEIEENLLDLQLRNDQNPNTSIAQGIKFENYIQSLDIWDRRLIQAGSVIEIWGLTFRILSPNEEKLRVLRKKWQKEAKVADTSAAGNDYTETLADLHKKDRFTEDAAPHNGSSIAFLLSFKGRDFLFLADAHPSLIIQSLNEFEFSTENRVNATLVKVAHHGSKGNMNSELLQLLLTDTFVITTNGDKHGHPDKQLLARLAHHFPKAQVYFNYPQLITKIFSLQDKIDFPHFQSFSCENKLFIYDN